MFKPSKSLVAIRNQFAKLALLVLVAGCESSSCIETEESSGDSGPIGGPLCFEDTDCEDGTLCATQGVHEIFIDAREEGECTEASSLVGSGDATWNWQWGGRPLANRLCVAQGLSSGTGDTADEKRTRQTELLADAGAKGIRVDIRWSHVEPNPSEWDFTRYDPLVNAAVAANLEVTLLLVYGVPWASAATDDDDKYPPDDVADFARFATAVVERYKDDVMAYEIWNEPNAGYRFYKPNLHGDAVHYGDLLVAGAAAIKEACPTCLVYSGGLFFHEQLINGAVEFLHDILSARPDALEQVDAIGLHPYPSYPPQNGPEDDAENERALGGMLADLQAVLTIHNVPAPPFALTEFGWPVYEEVDEQTQAAFLVRSLLLGASLGADPLCWYNLVNGSSEGSGFPPESDFGLYRYGAEDPGEEPHPKQARDALAFLSSIGASAVPAGPRGDPDLHAPNEGRFALEFTTDNGTMMALWRLEGEETIQLSGEDRSPFDFLGQSLGPAVDGVLEIRVGTSPTYLVP
jgi:hypothetical protein